MKKLLLILTLLFSVMFSSLSYAEWTKVAKGAEGDEFYVDFERIRKHGGYIYYWHLSDYLKPNPWGSLSGKIYNQGDCRLFRLKYLSSSFHKGPMGTGEFNGSNNEPDKEWTYPAPNSSFEIILKSVCNH